MLIIRFKKTQNAATYLFSVDGKFVFGVFFDILLSNFCGFTLKLVLFDILI